MKEAFVLHLNHPTASTPPAIKALAILPGSNTVAPRGRERERAHLHLRVSVCFSRSSPPQPTSHLSHWSHYQLLPDRKRASLLSWGSRCLPIVVCDLTPRYTPTDQGGVCLCVSACMCAHSIPACTISVCRLINWAWFSHPSLPLLVWRTGFPFSPLAYWMWTGL